MSDETRDRVDNAGALVTFERTLLIQLNAALTDGAVRRLRNTVGSTLEGRPLRALVVDLTSVDLMDSYITRCIRDLAISARLMGVPTIVCGVQPGVADTLVEMGLELGAIRTTLNVDSALRQIRRLGQGERRRERTPTPPTR